MGPSAKRVSSTADAVVGAVTKPRARGPNARLSTGRAFLKTSADVQGSSASPPRCLRSLLVGMRGLAQSLPADGSPAARSYLGSDRQLRAGRKYRRRPGRTHPCNGSPSGTPRQECPSNGTKRIRQSLGQQGDNSSPKSNGTAGKPRSRSGGAGNRTRVRKLRATCLYVRIWQFVSPRIATTSDLSSELLTCLVSRPARSPDVRLSSLVTPFRGHWRALRSDGFTTAV